MFREFEQKNELLMQTIGQLRQKLVKKRHAVRSEIEVLNEKVCKASIITRI